MKPHSPRSIFAKPRDPRHKAAVRMRVIGRRLTRSIALQGAIIGISVLAVGIVAYLAVTARPEDYPRPSDIRTTVVLQDPHPTLRLAAAAPQISQTPAPRPSIVPSVALLLRSNPTGAHVTVRGRIQGNTPLRLQGRVGERLTLVLSKGNLLWRGTVVFTDEPEQTMEVTLQRPQANPAGAVVPAANSQFEIALRSGIELYNQGWYGPAFGRFKHATSLDPLSAEAHLWGARALIKAYRYDEARRALDMVMTLQKSGPRADEATALRRLLPEMPFDVR